MSAVCHISNSLHSVWKHDETLLVMFDINITSKFNLLVHCIQCAYKYLCSLSNLLKSQQDLQLLLEEGELEEQLKNTLEADLETINTAAIAELKKRESHDFDVASKDTSHSGSIPGSEPLSRKEFVFDGLKYSPASSMQGSKASLSSSLQKGSKASLSSTTPPKGSKASLISETRLKGSKASLAVETPPKGSKASLVLETPQKGSKASLVEETPSKGSKASLEPETVPKEGQPTHVSETHSKQSKGSLLSEVTPKSTVNVESSSLPSEPSPPKEENDSKEAASVDIKVSKAGSIMNTCICTEVTKWKLPDHRRTSWGGGERGAAALLPSQAMEMT